LVTIGEAVGIIGGVREGLQKITAIMEPEKETLL
jgi:hypothetical protein